MEKNKLRNKNNTETKGNPKPLAYALHLCLERRGSRLSKHSGLSPTFQQSSLHSLSTAQLGGGDRPRKVGVGVGGVEREMKRSLDVNITMEAPQRLTTTILSLSSTLQGLEGGCPRPQAYTVLSITHSELPKAPRAPTRSLSSKGKSMPLTERLRFVQMFETLRGGL